MTWIIRIIIARFFYAQYIIQTSFLSLNLQLRLLVGQSSGGWNYYDDFSVLRGAGDRLQVVKTASKSKKAFDIFPPY